MFIVSKVTLQSPLEKNKECTIILDATTLSVHGFIKETQASALCLDKILIASKLIISICLQLSIIIAHFI